jgi:MFS family permease
MTCTLRYMAVKAQVAENVFDKKHRALTFGLILGITLFAFENLAITTVAPHIAESLNGLKLYGWMFTGFLLASLFSTVLGGEWSDQYGASRPLTIGLIIFAIGLLISSFATTMPILILGRIVQGLGGGAIITALYAVLNLAYNDALRPRILTLMASAWVVPALLGPALAGFVAEALSWRILFWGVVPLLVLVAFLTIPTFYRLNQERVEVKESRFPFALGLVMGTGLLLYGFGVPSWAMSVAMVLCGAVLAFWSLRSFVPKGTFTLKPGLPALIATRGLSFATFVGIEAYLSLMLSEVHGFSSALTGAVIAVGTISWTLGTWLQDRYEKRRRGKKRRQRIIWGTLILLLGSSLQILVLFTPYFSLLLTLLGWFLAGVGIGLAHSTISVLAFASAPEGKEGRISAALQLSEQFSSAFCTGLGGALLAYAVRSELGAQYGIALAFAVSSAVGVLGVIAAYRTSAVAAPATVHSKSKSLETL